MRYGTVHHEGRDRPAAEHDSAVFAIDDLAPSTTQLIAGGLDRVSLEGREPLEDGTFTLRPPVTPGKLICVGTNYRDHVAEMQAATGVDVREEPFPFGFIKPSTALAASGQPVALPAHGQKLDFEAELAVVIGDAAAATANHPLGAVAGYTILNDLSLRDWLPFPHALGLDAVVAKGWDGAAPLGPWITPAADVGHPADLPIQLTLNGETMQDSSTAQMIFDVPAVVAHYLRVLTLEPGDVIATGTPAGVGAARTPPRYLRAGDQVEITIGRLGTLVTPVESAR